MVDPRGTLQAGNQGLANKYTTCYSYTERGDLWTVVPPGTLGGTTYGRDDAGRVMTLTQPSGQVTTYNWTARGGPC